ncbi:MAG: hypothetical protein ACJA2E_001177 [Arenicella sp.]|jgi:hypothetical protein
MKMKNQMLMQKVALAVILCACFLSSAMAQSVDQVRWKSAEQVRVILGEPQSVTSPVGTHASYTMWKYENYTVAFANGRAFHLFKKNSLRLRNFDQEESY